MRSEGIRPHAGEMREYLRTLLSCGREMEVNFDLCNEVRNEPDRKPREGTCINRGSLLLMLRSELFNRSCCP